MPNIPDPYGGEGVVTSQTPATYQPPKRTTTKKPATTITPPPNIPDPYGGEGVVTSQTPATYQPPKATVQAPNIPDPYGGEGVVTSPTPATYQYVPRAATPTTAPNRVATLTDGSVDPYDVQGSGETGRVVETAATTIAQDFPRRPYTMTDETYRNILNEQYGVGDATIIPAKETPSTPSPVGVEIRPETGFISGSLEDKQAIAARDTTQPYGTQPPTQDEINRRRDYENITAAGRGYTDPNAPALDPYGVQADADRRDAAMGVVQKTAESVTQDTGTGGGGTGGGGGGVDYTGGGAATGTTGGTGTGTGGAFPTGTTGDALFNQALNMQFEWKPEEDPNYQIAVKQAEQAVTNSAFQSKLVELQAYFYNQAYDNFKADRAFIVDMAKIAYGREDEAWNRNMEMLKYKASRDDEMYSRSMRERSMALSEAKFAYDKEMAQAEADMASRGASLSYAASAYDTANKTYESMLSKWKASGYASKEVASFFGVTQGTSINSYTGSLAASKVATTLSAQYSALASDAAEMGKDQSYLRELMDYSTPKSTSKSILDNGTPAQANAYSNALNNVYQGMSGLDGTEAKAAASSSYSELIRNSSGYISAMGATYYEQLLAEVKKLM